MKLSHFDNYEKPDPNDIKKIHDIFDDSIEPSGYDRVYEFDGEMVTLREAMNRMTQRAEEDYAAGCFLAEHHGRCANEWTLFMGSYFLKDISDGSMKIRTPIEWVVLKREGYKWLLLTKECVERKRVNFFKSDNEEFDHWDKSEIRRYLNEHFLEEAFSDDERELIIFTTISPEENIIFDRMNGSETQDKLFLLSTSEVEQYLNDEHERIARFRFLTKEYDDQKNVSFNKLDHMNYAWWTRSPGTNLYTIACVNEEGTVDLNGQTYPKELGIRVAMWINIEKSTQRI